MPEFHVSVLAQQLCDAVAPAIDAHPDGVVVDATCGAGGHTHAILQRSRPARVILLDQDPAALAHAKARLAGAPCPLEFRHARFSTLGAVLDDLNIPQIAALIADIGVSSHQLDTGGRGFSFREDAPLDMRMDPTAGPTAAQVLENIEVGELADLLRRYGEEPEARRVAAAIVAARPTTTGALASVVENAMSGRARRLLGKRIHPATRTFQALRIFVNRELDELDALLEHGPQRLCVGGRMAVISFHSLEDRRVKRRFTELTRAPELPRGLPMTAAELPRARFAIPAGFPRRGAQADQAELDSNPRSRSARLRVIERVMP
ncbi:16S rRNA (cytosine(1402)-N(4))-methyltransferase RsmH [Enhygromyxa salina]|uniref:Ribosomal RNA small subunit methyltransferase H n=1 Tax=Enhygromyxa salina TaxID=215803 RepID=A0A2S9XTE0_9BACT|nr:16S rRNA (cytosine(1402)-N(4))-methyltransferase RsmH [Enhygromyxa salina]PRP96138.1 Ribosomal RNA small subunit methyltransferase H [Enhygromyxa salina]